MCFVPPVPGDVVSWTTNSSDAKAFQDSRSLDFNTSAARLFTNTPRYTNDTCAATGTNSTLQCPLNYASGVAEAFGPLDVPLSDASCSPETLNTADWKVEVCLPVLLL